MKDNSLSFAIFYSSSKTDLIRAARTFNSGLDLLFFQEHISCFPRTDQNAEDGNMHCNCLNFVKSNVTQNDHKMEADNYEVFTINRYIPSPKPMYGGIDVAKFNENTN